MAEFQSQTFNLAASTGYVFTLPKAVGALTFVARAECYVQLVGQGTAPATPTSAAVPAAGQATNFYHLLPGESLTTGIDPIITGQHEFPVYIAIWAVGSGNLTMMGIVHQ